ncbi:hypothetical protein D9M71_561980 [compost metagenome]
MHFGRATAGVDDPIRVGNAHLALAKTDLRRRRLGFLLRGGRLGGGFFPKGSFHGSRALLGDVFGRFVVTQAMEHRMAHRTVLGHFGKGHFRQQAGFEPVHGLELGSTGRIDHCGFLRLQGLELLMDAVEGRLGKAGADLARVAQLTAVAVMQSQEQRTEGTA